MLKLMELLELVEPVVKLMELVELVEPVVKLVELAGLFPLQNSFCL